jgi:hypothetical protein
MDKAFGIQATLKILLPHTLPPPDYTRPLGQVYKESAVQIIQATNSLRLLLVAAENGFPGQQSWVPDWSKPAGAFWRLHENPKFAGFELSLYRRGWELLITGPERNPSDLSPVHLLDPPNTDILIVQGHRAGQVIEVPKFERIHGPLEQRRETLPKNVCTVQAIFELICQSASLSRYPDEIFHLLTDIFNLELPEELATIAILDGLSFSSSQIICRWRVY